jgi:predicted transcriptional regulator of viral defense system
MRTRAPKTEPERLSAYVDRLQGSGRYWFTAKEAAAEIGGSGVAREAALRRLKAKDRLACPRRGFFVVVPLEHRSAGSPPATWFIDSLMAHLRRPYYVGLLSAAEIHGAAHQRPQVFQVVTDVPLRAMGAGRVRIEAHRNRNLQAVPVERVRTETGTMPVSTPEATAIDLVRYAPACGHLDNVATVLQELAERIDPRKLAQVAAKMRQPDAQRLGFLLERLGLGTIVEPLRALVTSWRRRPVLLRPDRAAHGRERDPCWYVIPNDEVTPDL